MKILLTSLLLASLFTGCSSAPKKDSPLELDSVTNDDFKKDKVEKFTTEQDKFGEVDDKAFEALKDESIQRLDDPSDLDIKTSLDEMIVKCYEGKYDEAFSLVVQNHDKYRTNPIFWNQVGTCYMLKGERRKALLFYNKALEYKSSYSPAYNNIGVMYIREGNDQKALVAFKRAIKSQSFGKTPRFNMGQVYLQYGMYDLAIKEFNTLYRVSKKDVDVLAGLGNAYLMKGKLDKAKSYFKAIDNDYWERPYVGINWAYLNYLQGDKDKAADIFKDVETKDLGPWKEYHAQLKNKMGVK